MEKFRYKLSGTCASMVEFLIANDVVQKVVFQGGCAGNTQGVGRLVEGMAVSEVVARLKGIDCKGKGTSCPDQFAKGLEVCVSKK